MREGWRVQTLADVSTRVIGRTPPRNAPRYWEALPGERPFCTIADMRGRSITPSREGVSALAEAEGKAKRVPAGSLLLSFKLTLGRVSIPTVDVFPNEAIAWVRPNSLVLQDYLAIALDALDWEAVGSRAVKGVTLNAQSLDALPIPVPPIAEQRRIVDMIGAVDDVIEAVAAREMSTEAMLCEVRDREFSRHPETAVGALVGLISGGRSPSASNSPPDAGQYGVLKVSAVGTRGFLPHESKTITNPAVFSDAMRVRKGDILITRANTSDRVGMVCRVDDNYPNLFLSDKTLRLTPSTGVDADCLVAVLQTTEARRQLSAAGNGTSASMKNISQSDIRGVRIGWPKELADQRELVSLVESLAETRDAAAELVEGYRFLRTEMLSTLLCGEHEIPASYDRLLDTSTTAANGVAA